MSNFNYKLSFLGQSIIANKELRISHIIPITIILALTALYCVFPLYFHKGLPDSPDAIHHLFYADHFKQALADGFLYPRWVLDANYGYGGPHFIFYSPLSYYLYAAVKFLHSSPVLSMITAIWLSFLLSGLTMFAVLVKQSGKVFSLIVAIIYQIIPFHIVDLYERGSYAELFAFVWIPLIIFFLLRITDTGNRMNILGLAISYAGLVLTHLVSGFMITFVIGIFVVYHYIMKRNKQVILGSVFAIALGLGLSSLYLLPVIFERQYVHIEYVLQCTFCDYKQNFLFTQNMFYLPNFPTYYVVMLHTVFAFEAILFILLILFIITHRQSLGRTASIGFFIVLFIVSSLLTTPLSQPLWAIIPFFPTLQFPWRWFLIMDVSLCFLIGNIFTTEHIAELKKTSFRKRIITYSLFILLGFSSVIMFTKPTIPEKSLIEIIYSEKIKAYVPHTIEYIPRWVTLLSEEKYSRASVISGEGLYEVLDWKSEQRIIKITSTTPVLFRIVTFYYPGWKAYLNGSEISIQTEKGTGAMLLDIPEGDHMLELKFVDTPVRYYGKLISLLSFVALGCFLLREKFRKSSKLKI